MMKIKADLFGKNEINENVKKENPLHLLCQSIYEISTHMRSVNR